MGDKSAIEWTDATWNPVRGCSIVSKGCTNCYAMRQAHRHAGTGGAYEGLTKMTRGGPVWTGEIREVHELLDLPLKWKRPRRIFVNSMSDLFHEDVHGDFIDAVLNTIQTCEHRGLGHKFQVLTKRADRMMRFMRHYEPIGNLWLGVSVEDQASADARIPLLLQTPAVVRWISAEPLLGPISFVGRWVDYSNPALHVNWLEKLNWVVAGGESGPGARPMHPIWARDLRDQCATVGVPFFFKQWGAWLPWGQGDAIAARRLPPTPASRYEDEFNRYSCRQDFLPNPLCQVFNVGKADAGRLLDGRTHDQYPA